MIDLEDACFINNHVNLMTSSLMNCLHVSQFYKILQKYKTGNNRTGVKKISTYQSR